MYRSGEPGWLRDTNNNRLPPHRPPVDAVLFATLAFDRAPHTYFSVSIHRLQPPKKSSGAGHGIVRRISSARKQERRQLKIENVGATMRIERRSPQRTEADTQAEAAARQIMDDASGKRATQLDYDRVRAGIRKSVGSLCRYAPDVIDDEVQNSFLKLLIHREKNDLESCHRLSAYLRTVARNNSIDRFRRESRVIICSYEESDEAAHEFASDSPREDRDAGAALGIRLLRQAVVQTNDAKLLEFLEAYLEYLTWGRHGGMMQFIYRKVGIDRSQYNAYRLQLKRMASCVIPPKLLQQLDSDIE